VKGLLGIRSQPQTVDNLGKLRARTMSSER
jgi:hypothetical protein